MTNKELSDFELSFQLEARIRTIQLQENKDDLKTDYALNEQFRIRDLNKINDRKLEIQSLAESALILAAFSGPVDSMDLIPSHLNEEISQQILTRILPHFDIMKLSNKSKWCLCLAKRKEVFIDGNILKLLSEYKNRLPETNRAGNILRELIQTGSVTDIPVHEGNEDYLIDYITALEWLKQTDIPGPNIEMVRAHLKSIQILPDHQILLKNGFIGRKSELYDINNFILKDGVSETTSSTSMILGGVGGSGKSTLLAKLCRDIYYTNEATIAVLDFDKPGMNPNDTSWLNGEITKQVSNQYPKLYYNLQQIRKEIYLEDVSNSEEIEFSMKRDRYYTGRIIGELTSALIAENLDKIPFVLILDTYEEVTQRNLHISIQNWLEYLREYMYPIQLKIIYSGRFGDNPMAELQLSPKTNFMPLIAFDRHTTLAFLKNLDLPINKCLEIADSKILPKRPLELKLLTKVLLSEQDTSVKDFERELTDRGGTDLFLGIVYQRVLLRITDPLIRKMACPGLIMRYLTAEIIQQVLFPAMSMPNISINECERIIDALSSYVWLAHKNDKSEVWHTKDLRRSMLKLMVNHDPIVSRNIHNNAINFFLSKDHNKYSHEIIYHKLMLYNTETLLNEIKDTDLRMAWPLLQADVDDLPVRSKVYLKFIAKRSVRIDEIFLLPEHLRDSAKRITAQQLAVLGYYERAYEVLFLDSTLQINHFIRHDSSTHLKPLEITICVNTGRWLELSQQQTIFIRSKNVKVLIEHLYLYTVINNLRDIEMLDIQHQISDHLNSLIEQERELRTIFREEIFSKFIASLITLETDNLLEQDLLNTCHRLHFLLTSHDDKKYTRESYLLKLLINKANLQKLFLSPSMLPIDPEQIGGILSILPDEGGENIRNYRLLLSDYMISSPNSLMKKINAFEKDFTPVQLEIKTSEFLANIETLSLLLTGSFIEFRNPCKYVMINALKNNDRSEDVMALFFEIMNIENRIFRKSVIKLQDNSEAYIDSFIEFIDRAWKLPEFMKKLSKIYPLDERILKVSYILDQQESKKMKYTYERLSALF